MNRLELLKNISSASKFEKGAVIVRDGDVGNDMYIILKGKADVYKNYGQPGELRLSTLSAGDFFGEMSLFLGKNRTATVVSCDEMIALRIGRDNVFDFLKSQSEFTFSFITALCNRLENTNNISTKLNTEGPASDVKTPNNEGPAPEVKTAAEAAPQEKPKTAPPAAAGSALSKLFPEGHGSYNIPIDKSDAIYLMDKSHTCPVCGLSFKTVGIKRFKLINERTDPDMRVHYKNVEPLYYDVVTCPKCWYSALEDIFTESKVNRAAANKILDEYRPELSALSGDKRDTFTVFAGYYLALACAPVCFIRSQIITGRLWRKLSWVYDDCEDEKMAEYAARQAVNDYMFAYESLQLTDAQSVQICLLLGELNLKLNDYTAARSLFFRVKTDKTADVAMKKQADDRMEDIRELLKSRENNP